MHWIMVGIATSDKSDEFRFIMNFGAHGYETVHLTGTLLQAVP